MIARIIKVIIYAEKVPDASIIHVVLTYLHKNELEFSSKKSLANELVVTPTLLINVIIIKKIK